MKSLLLWWAAGLSASAWAQDGQEAQAASDAPESQEQTPASQAGDEAEAPVDASTEDSAVQDETAQSSEPGEETSTPAPVVYGPEAPAPATAAVAEASRKKKRKKHTSAFDSSEFKLDFGGMVQYDLRFRPVAKHYGTYYQDIPDPPVVSRNELISRFKLNASYGRFGAVSAIDLVFRAYPKTSQMTDLSFYNQNSPFRIEAQDLYVYGRDIARGLDIRIGMQKAMFGVGDQFNPTNNVNPINVEDVLMFGQQQANLMARIDYSPHWRVSLTGILVPIFKPGLLPRTAYLGQQADRFPFVDPQARYNFATEEGLAAGDLPGSPVSEIFPTIVRNVAVQLPEFNAENMQEFFRIGTMLGPVDLALSYYRGFSDIPQPVRTDSYQIRQQACEQPGDVGLPADQRKGKCVDGVLANDVVLSYPRIQVLGLNLSGEAVIGYRFELGVYFPGEMSMPVIQHDVRFASPVGDILQTGPYAFPDGSTSSLTVKKTPFAKWTLGIDYTFGKHVYMNAQWVHGFPDDFGAGDWITRDYAVRRSYLSPSSKFSDCMSITSINPVTRKTDGTKCSVEYLRPKLGDYLVLGFDINFASQRGLLRMFTIWDLSGVWIDQYEPDQGARVMSYHNMFTKDGFSAVLFPDLRWNFGHGFELHAGGLVQLGQAWSKFGSAETGGHQIWTRARYTF